MRMLIACGLALLAASPAFADDLRLPARASKAWQEECGSCHLAFPPSMLAAKDWRTMMRGLERHFGVNATLDEKTRLEILGFLEANAARKQGRASVNSLRITETPWFIDEHDEVPGRVWSDPQVKSAANCAACHRDAERGSYDEDGIRMPSTAERHLK